MKNDLTTTELIPVGTWVKVIDPNSSRFDRSGIVVLNRSRGNFSFRRGFYRIPTIIVHFDMQSLDAEFFYGDVAVISYTITVKENDDAPEKTPSTPEPDKELIFFSEKKYSNKYELALPKEYPYTSEKHLIRLPECAYEDCEEQIGIWLNKNPEWSVREMTEYGIIEMPGVSWHAKITVIMTKNLEYVLQNRFLHHWTNKQ